MEIRQVVFGEGAVSLSGIIAVTRWGVPVRISGSSRHLPKERMDSAQGLES